MYQEMAVRGESETVDSIYEQISQRLFRAHRRLCRGKDIAWNKKMVRRYLPIYTDLLYCGFFICEKEHREFIHTVKKKVCLTSDDRRVNDVVARLSR